MTTRAAPPPAKGVPDQAPQPAPAPAAREAIIINVPGPNPPPPDKGWGDAAAAIAVAWAWPAALILVLLIFKRPITRFIDRLRSMKGAGVELSAEQLIEELPARATPAEAEEVKELNPLDTIISAWVAVEKAARDASQQLRKVRSGERTMAYSTVIRNVTALEGERLVGPDLRPLVLSLAKIRNQAVHQPDVPISQEALAEFVANAAWAVAQLEAVKPSMA